MPSDLQAEDLVKAEDDLGLPVPPLPPLPRLPNPKECATLKEHFQENRSQCPF